MKKKFLSSLLFAALVGGVTSTFTACKDYDDDISNLRALIDKNTAALDAIQKLIDSGSVITSVTPITTGDGGVQIALSNGSTYNITNGAKGADGKDGVNGADGKDGVNGADGKDGVNGADGKDGVDGKDADVWEIGENGYWYKNGEETPFKAVGTDGKDGADGADGTDGTNGTDGKDGATWTIGSDGYWYKDGNKTEWKAVGTDGTNGTNGSNGTNGTDGKDGKDGGYYKPNPETGVFDYVYLTKDDEGKDIWAEVPTTIKYTAQGAVTAVWADDVLVLSGVEGGEGDDKIVTINLKSKLKSLVFEPDFYYQGIEALDFLTIKYNENTVSPVNANGNFDHDAPVVGELCTMAPDLAATYHLNPTNAKMVDTPENYHFIAYNKAYTRSKLDNVSESFEVYEAVLTRGAKAGFVTVHAKYDGDVVKSIAKDEQVTVLALQYKDPENNDGIVTSDYAAIRADVHQNLVLNNPKYTPQHTNGANTETASHLYTTAAAAIEAEAQIQVAWDNDKGIDLREWVNTHYFGLGANGELDEENCLAWDDNAAAGTVEKSGFKYSFELVGYEKGVNKTKQSVHAAINENGYTLRPQMPTAEGLQAAYGADQNRATIGREPLVRVILTDTINGRIAAVGYIKVAIQETVEDPTAFTLDLDSNKDYTLACQGNHTVIETTWNEIEHKILAQLNMSKEAFEAAYVLDDDDNNNLDVNQFAENTTMAVKVDPTKKIGNASQTTVDKDGNKTEVISWVVADNQAYQLFGKEKKTSVETYIRYTLKDGQSGPYKFFYVKLKWTPETINVNPETKFGTDVRIRQYWYAANNPKAGTGYDDIHGNVVVPGTQTNDCAYKFDIRNTLVGNELTVSPLEAPYAGLNADMVHGVYFVGGTFAGSKQLYANSEGTKLYADPLTPESQLIATIDPTSGVIEYADNDVAKEYLNAFDHTDLANTVTAKLAVKANVCYGLEVPVAENTFNVKFLRPVDIKNAQCEPFEDALDNGSTQALTMDFIDWRDYAFLPNHKDYFTYYGVTAIALDEANATTDINGNVNDKLKTVAPNVSIKYNGVTVNEIMNGKFGSITYKNNGTTVGDFNIWIPGTVTYKWGKINIKVHCSVAKTHANANRK